MRRSAGDDGAWSADTYAYCEVSTVTTNSPHHIRRITSVGLKLGGGADTPTLCGRDLLGGWDVRFVRGNDDPMTDAGTEVNGHVLVCPRCAQALVDREGR